MKNHQKYWICSVPGVHHNKSSFPISGAFWLPERLTRVQNITQGVTYFWWCLMVADFGCQKDDVMSKNTPRGVSPRSKAQESCQCNPSQFSFHSKKFFSETKGFSSTLNNVLSKKGLYWGGSASSHAHLRTTWILNPRLEIMFIWARRMSEGLLKIINFDGNPRRMIFRAARNIIEVLSN